MVNFFPVVETGKPSFSPGEKTDWGKKMTITTGYSKHLGVQKFGTLTIFLFAGISQYF